MRINSLDQLNRATGKMSFIDITDPKRRDAIVADYLATVKRIQRRNLDERAEEVTKNDENERLFNPIVKSTEKSTAALAKEIIPMRAELRNINEKLSVKKEDDIDDPAQIDHYFGIEKDGNGDYVMGNKVVEIDESSNIYVDGVRYEGTPGLWSLIKLKKPDKEMYTFKDLSSYKDLTRRTDVMNHPRNVTKNSRPKTTYKWRQILSSFGGSGLHFLPGDIKGLKTKLNLLLAEYAAGNRTSSRNEIVVILDELLRRKSISRREYTEINSYLSQCL